MSKNYNIFIFFRDLRLKDNTGLIQAQKQGYKNILPIFVFVDDQINPKKNKYFSNNSVQFLCESLNDLHRNLTSKNKELYIFHSSKLINVLESIFKNINIQGVHFNQDYTTYAMNRQNIIMNWCNKNKVECCIYEDYLLSNIGTFNKKDNTVYGVYGPFKNNVYSNIDKILKPKGTSVSNITTCSSITNSKFYIPINKILKFYVNNPNKLVSGNIKDALKLLRKTSNMSYEINRNDMTFTTSLLSAYIKYGILSIRDVFHYFQKYNQEGLCDQLIWREFYFYVCYYNPNILKYSKNYNSKYDKIVWVDNKKHFKAWCDGNTGYPIVDACMKQLNKTGYMHNRGRLISANFLNRMLGMDWRLGEKYFANNLTDYDPCVNNGNWQWIASTGVDPKPYFQRLFNPWLQSSKFDKDALYIKTWLPQLTNIPAAHLHEWNKHCDKYDMKEINYCKPIVKYEDARKRSVEQYRKVLN